MYEAEDRHFYSLIVIVLWNAETHNQYYIVLLRQVAVTIYRLGTNQWKRRSALWLHDLVTDVQENLSLDSSNDDIYVVNEEFLRNLSFSEHQKFCVYGETTNSNHFNLLSPESAKIYSFKHSFLYIILKNFFRQFLFRGGLNIKTIIPC